jgi:hypothetical protein
MNRVWQFSDIQFVSLWDLQQDGLLPAPLTFVSKQPYLNDFRAEIAEYQQRLAQVLGDTFDGVLDLVAQPDVRVVMEAKSTADPDDPQGRVRVLGAARGDRGYVVKQLPGESVWHAGGFLVGEFAAAEVAEATVAELPVVAAGTMPDTVLAACAPDPAEPEVIDRERVSHRRRAERFLAAPTTMTGTVTIAQGRSKYGPRGIARRRLEWRDLSGDGRYLVGEAARAVTPRGLADAVEAEMRAVYRVLAAEGVARHSAEGGVR